MSIEESIKKTEDFKKDLESIINKHGWDNICNTPDFILANYLYWCLSAYHIAVKDNFKWHNAK